jgi:glycosyltransferase involved in cell wall biosynthesis
MIREYMNIQIITSSYPEFEGDPSGTAGLFVQSFANELVSRGHHVIVQPVSRKKSYQTQPGIVIEPIPWRGGDQPLASMSFLNPLNWVTFLRFFLDGKKHTQEVYQRHKIDRTLCMWIIPSGVFGYWIKKKCNKEYDVWALGSDVWKVRKIPFWGRYWIRKVVQNACGVFADGFELAGDVREIAQKECRFLPSSRILPKPEGNLPSLQPSGACHLLFVGRYHKNKGPDILIKAIGEIERSRRRDLRVHLFGTGPLEAHLKAMRELLQLEDIVTINGPIGEQDLANYLSHVSFLIIPSRIESIPVVFSDALQAGTPVISTPVGDLPDLIKRHACGILSDGTSPRSFARAIERAMGMKKEAFRKNVRDAYETFKIATSVDEWLKGAAIEHV